jgi:hypothetical protein
VVVDETTPFMEQVPVERLHRRVRLLMRLQTEAAVERTLLALRLTLVTLERVALVDRVL